MVLMKHHEIINKVIKWSNHFFPGIKTEKERFYKITERIAGVARPYLRVDIVGKNKLGEEVFAIECKTINDHKQFRDLAAAIGQAYVLKKMFGKAFIALEVNPSFQDKYKLSRYQWLTNINRELGIGIIFVGKRVVLIEDARKEDAKAKTLFIPMKK